MLMESEATLWPHNHLDTVVGVSDCEREKLCVCMCVCRGARGHVGPTVYKSISVDTVPNGH